MPARGEEDLLERDAELAALAELIELARGGKGSVLCVKGPAGIGKTRLVEASMSHGTATGLAVAAGRAGELERDFPFGVVHQLFEPAVARASAAEREELFGGAAALAAPALGEPGPAGTTEATYAVLHGLYWLTANLAAREPLVIAVDDAHWADSPSLRFLAYLAKRVEGLPLLLVVSRRSDEPDVDVELLYEIESGPRTRIVAPSPLSEHAVAHLVRQEMTEAAEDAFCRACSRATGGNPFYLRELLATMRAEAVAGTAGDAPVVSAVAPDTVAASVRRRLRHLPERASALATAAAVLGDGGELRLAGPLAGLDPASGAQAREELVRAGFLREAEAARFTHPIVRAAVYRGLGAAARSRAHAQAARLLEADGADPGRVAAQLVMTEASGDSWAIDVLREAAAAAAARGAPDVAATYLRRALEEPLDRELRSDLLLELGRAEIEAHPPPVGIDHLREARALTQDRRKRATLSLALARGAFPLGDFPAAAAALEESLAELGDDEPDLAEQLEARLLIASMASLTTFPRAYRRLERLVDEARAGSLSDPSLLVNVGFFAVNVVAPAAAGTEFVEQALRARREWSADEAIARLFAPLVLAYADRLETAQRVVDEGLADAQRTGSVVLFAFGTALRSHVAWRVGAIPLAEADARTALQMTGVHEARFALPFVIMGLVDALLERGALEEAERAIVDNGVAGPLPELFHLNSVLDSRGRLRIAQGRAREALDDLLECGRRLEQWKVSNPGYLPWRSSAASALTSLGRRDEALELALQEVELARRFDVPRELSMALRAAGLAAGGNPGLELLHEAVDVLEHSPAKAERARALTDLGAALRRAGRRQDAREPLRHGLDAARRCGATALVERAHAELVATGARPRRVDVTGVDALTASERRVAEMVASGMTNREVAQALFVTEKTIEWHLSQAYRKLDIHSRTQLRGALDAGATGEQETAYRR